MVMPASLAFFTTSPAGRSSDCERMKPLLLFGSSVLGMSTPSSPAVVFAGGRPFTPFRSTLQASAPPALRAVTGPSLADHLIGELALGRLPVQIRSHLP